ncbi:MAG: DNA repair protein RecO [Candidatus Paracaedibacteraceae bacterium]|nr:DNA repair protein RecO [Candidatus Paracaedibacteraceae bacterium]
MKWQGEGLILSVRRHGESSAVVSLLTRDHGRHAGIVRLTQKNRSIIQPGNYVQANWSARLPEHLGAFQVELISSTIARIMSDSLRLTALLALFSTLDRLLAERHLYPEIFDLTLELVTAITSGDDDGWLRLYAGFELRLLEQLGYGLDLSRCVATGERQDLAYVSPKSGCAVSRAAGEPYAGRLFALPDFFLNNSVPTLAQIREGLRLTGYFIAKNFFDGIESDTRARLTHVLTLEK